MTASVSTALTEAHQGVDLAVLFMPDCFFDAWLLGIAHGTNFFGTRNWGFGFGLMRFELAA